MAVDGDDTQSTEALPAPNAGEPGHIVQMKEVAEGVWVRRMKELKNLAAKSAEASVIGIN